MAGAADNPGDFIPAISKKPLIDDSSTIKSPLSDSALIPANVLIFSLKLISFIE